jgi:peptidoglycan hydrolase-like protein with peptidoglycan-binding domain
VQKTLATIKSNSTVPLLSVKTPANSNAIPYIKFLQDSLRTQGYDVDVNGVFDEKTKEAVINYQSSDGLTKDGVVGKNTWKSILALNDINIEPKVVNVNPNTNTSTSPNKTAPKDTTASAPTNTNNSNTPSSPNNKEITFKNTKNQVMNFSALEKATNKWYENKDTMGALIKNNMDNKEFILALNKLYQEKTNRNLIGFLTDVYSRSLLGGRGFEIGVKLFDILTNYIVDPATDAKIFNWCISGVGTEDELINIIINKRAKMPEDYKKKILASYQENYESSFAEDMLDDGVDESQIKKIDSDYFETEV